MLRLHTFIIPLLALTALPAASEDALDAKNDPRLQREISVFQPPVPLASLLKKLSEQTGISLQAERSISQYRAILVAEEKPLHEVLRKLAEAFGFQWERRGKEGEPPGYMLTQPAEDLARESAELGEMERLADEIWRYTASLAARWTPESKQAMRTRMEELRKTYEERLKEGKTSRAETFSIIREAHAVQSIQQPWRRAGILALSSLSPTQLRQLREGAVLQVRGDSLPPEALRLILDEWRETEMPAPISPDEPGVRSEKPYQSKPWDNVEVWLFRDSSAEDIKSLVYFTGPDLREGGKQIHPVTVSPWDLYMMIRGLERGMLQPRLPEDPLFQKDTRAAEFDRKSTDYLLDPTGVELAHFARANGVRLAGEWYPFSIGGMPTREPQPVASWKQLPVILRDYNSELSASEGWVLVRSFARALARRTSIPHAQIAQWLLKPRAEGKMTLDDYAQIAFLHERQQSFLQAAARRLQTGGSGELIVSVSDPLLEMSRNVRLTFTLQAYSLLTPAHKRALLNGEPVPLSAMPRPAAARFQVAASVPPAPAEPGESLPPEITSSMALVLSAEQEETEQINWSQVPEEVRSGDAFRPWLETLSPEERARVVSTSQYLQITFGLTDGERQVMLARLSVIQ